MAYAARAVGLPDHIFLPQAHQPAKRAMIEMLGATIHVGGEDIDAAKDLAREFSRQRGHLFVDDGESLDVMEGAGTVGLETAQRLPHIDFLFLPMGRGSLAAGCAAAVKGLQPRARVIAVQAEGAPAMVESFRARRPVERPVRTIAEGLACRVPAERALEAIWKSVDDVVVTPEELLLSGVRTLAESAHVLAEPSGAAALAAAWMRRAELKDRRAVRVVTGANIAPEMLRQALVTPLLR